jgi:periplasmic protein TonB
MVAGRLGRMGIVAGMHVAAFYMIATSFGIIKTVEPPVVLTGGGVDVPRTPDEPDPVPLPTIPNQHQVTVPIPIVPIDATGSEGVTARAVAPDEIVIDEGGSSAVEPRIPDTAPRIDSRRPLTLPAYPPDAIRANYQGQADLEVYVLANGRVSEARIRRSTGFDSLDRSAIQEAKRNWRLMPATHNGEAIAQWYTVRVTFKLTGGR